MSTSSNWFGLNQNPLFSWKTISSNVLGLYIYDWERDTERERLDTGRRTSSKSSEDSSQQCDNCFSYSKFAFTFTQLMKSNQTFFPHNRNCGGPNVAGPSDPLIQSEQTPGGRQAMCAWLDWQSSITRAYQAPRLQLSFLCIAKKSDLCRDYSQKKVYAECIPPPPPPLQDAHL